MKDNNVIFTKWYKSFLKSTNESISDEFADAETELVKEHVDCNAYVEATNADKCLFCADENALNGVDFYALTDVGRERDELGTEKIGGRKDAHILPLCLPMCKTCRRNYFLVHTMPTLICTVLIVAALIVSNLNAVKEIMYKADIFVPVTMRPFFFFVVVTALTILICALLRKYLSQELSKKTTFSPLKVKGLEFLGENGWKMLYRNRQYKAVFTRNRPEYMCGEELPETISEQNAAQHAVRVDDSPKDTEETEGNSVDDKE